MSDLLERADVAARLNISPRTLTDLVARREIAHVRVGKLLRFNASDVDAYLARQRRPAAPPPPATSTPALQALPALKTRRFD